MRFTLSLMDDILSAWEMIRKERRLYRYVLAKNNGLTYLYRSLVKEV